MKPYENFVENILGAVRSSQGKDPAAATAIIQEALKTAGLLKGAASPAARDAQASGKAPFVDLNPAPDWVERMKARMPAGMPGVGMPGRARTVGPATHGPGQFLEGSFTN